MYKFQFCNNLCKPAVANKSTLNTWCAVGTTINGVVPYATMKSPHFTIQTTWTLAYNRLPSVSIYHATTRLRRFCRLPYRRKPCFTATAPDTFTGRGQSHQMSPQMYNALQAVCRCGRPKVGAHMLRCLQAQPPPIIPPRQSAEKLMLPKTSLGINRVCLVAFGRCRIVQQKNPQIMLQRWWWCSAIVFHIISNRHVWLATGFAIRPIATRHALRITG